MEGSPPAGVSHAQHFHMSDSVLIGVTEVIHILLLRTTTLVENL